MKRLCNQDGFTLIELLIGIALASILGAAFVQLYTANSRAHVVEQDVVALQQDARAAMSFITRELRDAGYDPFLPDDPALPPTHPAGAGIVEANATYIYFTKDDHKTNAMGNGEYDPNGDGDLNDPTEHRVFCLFDEAATPGPPFSLGYTEGSNNGVSAGANPVVNHGVHNHRTVIANVDGLEFFYGLRDDSDPDNISLQYTLTPSTFPNNLEDVRTVRVTLLVRAPNPDPRYTDSTVYTPASGNVYANGNFNNGQPFNDNFRRRLLTTTVRLRSVR